MAAVVRAAPTPTKAPAPVAAPAPARVAPVVPAGPRLNLGGGAPIPTPTRMRLESSLGANLSGVRVHSGPGAATAAGNLNARAFAFGPQIVLGSGQRADDLPLMGHEAAHVIQQQAAPTPQRWADGVTVPPTNARGFAGPAVVLGRAAGERATLQRWTPSTSDRFEGEANRAAAAVARGEPFTVTERTAGPRVQPFLGIDIDIAGRALDYIAPKANAIPGFRMFTVVLGVNPINMSPVDRSPANVIRAVIEFMLGGALITQALDNHGIIDKVGGWVGEQLKTLGLIGGSIKDALIAFVKSLGVKDIGNLGGVWDRAKQIFTDPIDRIKSFVSGLVTGIITFIKDAILMPLAKLAERTSGWDLLTAVLGKNPITGAAVPRTAETLIPGFLKLIGQQEVWENMKKANALGRAWAWFQSAMAAITGFVNQIPALAIATFKSLELADIILVPRAFAKVGAVFGTFLGNFTGWAGTAVWNLLEIVFDVVSPGAFDYIKRTGAALKSILKNPLPFVGNLVKAAKLGFQNFAGNFGTHFKAGLLNWLTGSLPGLYIPTSFSLIEIGKFVLSVLGVSWPQIRGKIVKALGPSGETIMTWAETGVDVVVALVKGGPAAAWEVIKEKLTDLKDTVIGGITDMVVDFVVKTAIPKLIAMFIPGVGFIPAIVSIYQTIQTFMQQLAKIAQVIKGFIDSIVAIAAGNIGAAAGRVESILAGLLSLAISFLAGAFGLGKVSDKVRGIINKIRAKIDKAIDAALAWIVAKAKALFAKAFSKTKSAAQGVLKEPFSMGPEGHTITVRLKGDGIEITMASDRDLVLSAQLGQAITEVSNDKTRQATQTRAILGHLTPAKAFVDGLRGEYVAAGRPEAFETFLKPRLARIIGHLSVLAKYDPPITSLQHIISVGKVRLISKGYSIRKKLYDRTTGGGWTTLSKSRRLPHVAKISAKMSAIWKLRDDSSDPTNFAKAKAQWDAAQAAKEIPSPKKLPAFKSYDHPKHFVPLFKYETDHIKSLGEFWNEGQKNNSTDADRAKTTLDPTNLQVLTEEENKAKSGVEFDRDVGPKFSSVVASCPENSKTIDDLPFEGK